MGTERPHAYFNECSQIEFRHLSSCPPNMKGQWQDRGDAPIRACKKYSCTGFSWIFKLISSLLTTIKYCQISRCRAKSLLRLWPVISGHESSESKTWRIIYPLANLYRPFSFATLLLLSSGHIISCRAIKLVLSLAEPGVKLSRKLVCLDTKNITDVFMWTYTLYIWLEKIFLEDCTCFFVSVSTSINSIQQLLCVSIAKSLN